jgi:ankyrin repeat protein
MIEVVVDPSETGVSDVDLSAPCALCQAVRKFDRVSIVRLTARKNLHIDTVCTTCHMSPLSWAMDKAPAEFVVYIVQLQFKMLTPGNRDVLFGTTLDTALRQGRADVTFGLLRLVKNQDKKIFFMSKALLTAAEIGFTTVIKDILYPLEWDGAFVDAVDADGNTSLMVAAAHGRWQCVDVLLLSGADVNHQNKQGDTALIMAVSGYHVDSILLLLKSNAHPLIRNRAGRTAISLARDLGFYDKFAESFATVLNKISFPDRPVATVPEGSIRDMDNKVTTTGGGPAHQTKL